MDKRLRMVEMDKMGLKELQRQAIAEILDATGWSPTRLGNLANLSPSTLNRFLSKKRAVKHALSADTMNKVQAAYQKHGSHPNGTSDLLPGFSHEIEELSLPAIDRPANGVLELGVSAGAGGGMVVVDEPELGLWVFPQLWLQAELRADAQELRIITIEGDSMEGVLKSGDKVIVHIRRTQPSPPGVFILFDGVALVAKRLEYLEGSDPPTVRISSSNPSYPPYERTVDEINIVGRVLGRWERL